MALIPMFWGRAAMVGVEGQINSGRNVAKVQHDKEEREEERKRAMKELKDWRKEELEREKEKKRSRLSFANKKKKEVVVYSDLHCTISHRVYFFFLFQVGLKKQLQLPLNRKIQSIDQSMSVNICICRYKSNYACHAWMWVVHDYWRWRGEV